LRPRMRSERRFLATGRALPRKAREQVML